MIWSVRWKETCIRVLYNIPIHAKIQKWSNNKNFSNLHISNIHLVSNLLGQEMWWLNDSAPDFWGRCPGFESGIFHNDPDALQDHCAIMKKTQVREGNLPLRSKKEMHYKKLLGQCKTKCFLIEWLKGPL